MICMHDLSPGPARPGIRILGLSGLAVLGLPGHVRAGVEQSRGSDDGRPSNSSTRRPCVREPAFLFWKVERRSAYLNAEPKLVLKQTNFPLYPRRTHWQTRCHNDLKSFDIWATEKASTTARRARDGHGLGPPVDLFTNLTCNDSDSRSQSQH